MKNHFDVSGKTIIVTGGAGGLGVEFSRTLIEQDARVLIVDRMEKPRDLGALLNIETRNRALYIQADITDKPALEQVCKNLPAGWAEPEGLINNAAVDAPPHASGSANCPFEQYGEQEWDRVMNVNAKGVFLACQVFGTRFEAAGRGSIVNISSIYGMVSPDQRLYSFRAGEASPFFKPVAYCASKSSILNLTRYLATYWADRHVRVNTLTLGGVYADQDPDFVEAYQARTPMKRMARPDEYNGAALFLLSDASSYMTGSNLVIDGGWTAW